MVITRRVLLIAPAAYPLGGVAIWIDTLMSGLSQQGWECVLGLTSGHHCDPHQYVSEHPWDSVEAIRNRTGSREGRIRSLEKCIRKVRPDIVVAVYTPDTFLAASRLGAKRPRVVMALHGLEPQNYEDIEQFGAVIDRVVVTCGLARALVKRLTKYPINKVAKIPAGVPQAKVDVRPPSKPLHIVYVGRLTRDAKRVQDIPGLLIALDRLGVHYRFWLAGDGDERESLERELSAVRGEVEFLGFLSRAELYARVYQPGRVLLITSERETGPLVAWEAMANGMLVVSSEYRGLRAEGALRHGETALVFPVGDHEAAAVELSRAQNPVIYRELTRAGVDLVNRKYSIDSMIQSFDGLLRKLMDESCAEQNNELSGFDFSPDGRVSKFLGHRLAEDLRVVFRRKYIHSSAGGEWPHSYGSPAESASYSRAVESSDQ